MRILIAGGGWAGCAAALQAASQGHRTLLLERADMLLGTGLVGGIFRNNGRYTAAEECIALGCGRLFQIMDQNARHQNIEFPGHHHASLYDIVRMPGAVQSLLTQEGVEIRLSTRIVSVRKEGNRLISVTTDSGTEWEADAFIDATGTAGPPALCRRNGNGCAMCVLRCPSFGGRISLSGLAGASEYASRREDGQCGAMSGSCKLLMESLSPAMQRQLTETGVLTVPVPSDLLEDHLSLKACQQYALPAFSENLVLLDTGQGKLMTPYFPLEKLRQIPGLEQARYADPYAGGVGNSMRFLAMAPHDGNLKVLPFENLWCAGEKAGPLVGHTEAILTGSLAAFNAAHGRPLSLPRSLAVGEGLAWTFEQLALPGGVNQKYTFSGSVLLEHLDQLGLYTSDAQTARDRVRQCGLTAIFYR